VSVRDHRRAILDAVASAPSWPTIVAAIAAFDGPHGVDDTQLLDHAIHTVERAAVQLLVAAEAAGGLKLIIDAYAVPRLLRRRRHALDQDAFWRQRQQRLAQLADTIPDARTRVAIILMAVLYDSIVDDPGAALIRLLDRIAALGSRAYLAALPWPAGTVAQVLLSTGCCDGDSDALKRRLEVIVAGTEPADGAALAAWCEVVTGTLYDHGFPAGYADAVFEAFVIPALARAADGGHVAVAQCLDERVGQIYVKQAEGAGRFARIQELTAPPLHRAGQAARRASAEPPAVYRRPAPASPRVGFVLHAAGIAAHTVNVITFLRGLSALGARPIDPIVYVVAAGETDGSLARVLAGLATPLRVMPDRSCHPAQWLRAAAIADNVAAVVFISVPSYLAFAAGYGVAPVLAFWAMKYHGFASPGVDAYLSVGNFVDDWREVDGRRWRSCRAALPPLTDSTTAADGRQFRADHGIGDDRVVLACVGREEKLLDPGYLDALTLILAQCPEAVFVWTGRATRAAEVSAELERRGIGERCRHAGWLANTRVAAQALDIFADSFPFASGHTAYEAMAAGKPLVVLKTAEALESSAISSLVPLHDGRAGTRADQAAVRTMFTAVDGTSLLPCVETVDAYVALAVRLVRDADRRRQVGAACRAFTERFARDERTFAATTCRHLLDVIDEKAPPGSTVSF
jgi:hypothetical protein